MLISDACDLLVESWIIARALIYLVKNRTNLSGLSNKVLLLALGSVDVGVR